MTSRYKVGGNALCTDTRAMPASSAASAWLARLHNQGAGDSMFVTPYADPDVSALSHAGLDTALGQSYSLGDTEAGLILGRTFSTRSMAAWPEGGTADASVLATLAHQGFSTTVLASDQMPPTSYMDDAVAHVTTGFGTPMSVLLADSQITGLLGSATASAAAGAQFAVRQEFLAETAMISAQAPNTQRSVVIAPPSRWDPSEAEAAALLSESSAPWLRPVSLASLSERSSAVTHAPLAGSKVARQELTPGYLSEAASAQQLTTVYLSLLAKPDSETRQQLATAVAVTESAAWRGNGSAEGGITLTKLRTYITDSEKQVQIVSGNKVVLGGASGAAPVSVSNRLPVPVEVRVHASVLPGSQLTISDPDQVILILPNATSLVRIQVHSAALGSSLLQLQLLTRNGVPIAAPPQSLSVETTRFGAALLILIAVALGVLVLTSIARWTRRWLRDGGSGHHVSGRSVSEDSADITGVGSGGSGGTG